jgi:hypothetical protein
MIVEAVRAVQPSVAQDAVDSPLAADPVANPAAVSRFQAAMAAEGPQSPAAADPVPFASEATAAWRSAQVNNQGILHRIHALTAMSAEHALSAPEMIELQYEVANLAFQQEVVTKVADKSSNAIQTLIKNQ